MQLTPPFPPPTVIIKHGTAVENRIQQWLWEINNKEHRAAWPLPPLAANQSLAPISEHVPQAKLTPYIEQERREGMGFGWATWWLWESASPPLKAFLPLPARRLLQHLHTRSRLSVPFFLRRFWTETRIIASRLDAFTDHSRCSFYPPLSTLVCCVPWKALKMFNKLHEGPLCLIWHYLHIDT